MPTKKKAVKKKAVKKKTTMKNAAKTPAKYGSKPAKKKKTIIGGGARAISFGCETGFCVPSEDPFHMRTGDRITMTATTSTVTVHFPGGSPFVEPPNPFTIPKGGSVTKTVKAVSTHPKKFKYKLKCVDDTCPTPSDDPQMIID